MVQIIIPPLAGLDLGFAAPGSNTRVRLMVGTGDPNSPRPMTRTAIWPAAALARCFAQRRARFDALLCTSKRRWCLVRLARGQRNDFKAVLRRAARPPKATVGLRSAESATHFLKRN